MKHIIRKQLFDLQVGSKEEAYRLQQLISEHYRREIIPILQQAFDAVSSDEKTILIHKLEIDLGTITEKDIAMGRWTDLVFKKISEQLDRLIKKEGKGDSALILSNADSETTQWLFYMRRGFLPWNKKETGSAWQTTVLQTFATDHRSIDQLRELIRRSEQAVLRIILQHDKKFIVGLLESLSAKSQKNMPGIVDELTEILLFIGANEKDISYGNKQAVQQLLWLQVVKYIAANESGFTTEKCIEYLLALNIPLPEYVQKLSRKLLSRGRVTAPFIARMRNSLKNKKSTGTIAGKKKKNSDEDREEDAKSKEIVPSRYEKSKMILQADDEKTDREQRTGLEIIDGHPVDADGIFVSYAGLVLLHPFLNLFFKNLGWVSEGKFSSLIDHQKALYMLHYLATGEIRAEEHELVVAKILCGYPLHQPVDKKIRLDDNEIAEGDELLVNVIAQWEILKNTSADGLREAFLQREGKLYEKNERFYLQVENSGIDILLDHLPWNLGMISLPWLKELIRVEWR